jgi:DNA-directed RNA polymerase subunit RPC12/RpoP
VNKEIDHEYTDNIVCPFCGRVEQDSWEIQPDEEDLGLQECGSCGKSYYAWRSITIDYSTEKARYGTCKHCGVIGVIEDRTCSFGEYKDLCIGCGQKEYDRLWKEYVESLKQIGDRPGKEKA